MKKVKIGDICEILNGYAFKSEKYVLSGVRVIRIANVQKGYIEDADPVFYPDDSRELEKYMLYEGDLLISLTGNVGRVALLDKNFLPAALNQRVACLRFKRQDVLREYVFHFLNSNIFEQKCIAASKGVAQKNISTEWLRKYEIPLVSIERQKHIVEVLNKVCVIVNDRKKQLEKYDELIKARFVEVFGDENNSKRWDVVNIEDVADVQVGVVIKPSQYYADERSGIKAFRSLNIGDGHIKDCDWVYFTREGHEKNSKSILKENDLLIVRSGAPGTACVVTKEYAGCNAVDVIIAHPNCDIVNPYYLCTYTNMSHGKKQIKEGTGGAAQQHFNVGKYNKLQLMLPPIELQDRFVRFMKQVDKLKSVIQEQLKETQLLFDSLMQQYFG